MTSDGQHAQIRAGRDQRGRDGSGENAQQRDPGIAPYPSRRAPANEGFEESERALIDHASHGDQQAAHAILHDQGAPEEEGAAHEDSESDHEHSSELGDER